MHNLLFKPIYVQIKLKYKILILKMPSLLSPPQNRYYKKTLKRLARSHVHHGLSFPVVGLLAILVLILCANLNVELTAVDDTLALEIYIPMAHAQTNKKHLSDFISVDVMKLTKDTMSNQLSDVDIKSAVDALAQTQSKYLAVSLPLDASTDYPESSKPYPRSAEAYTLAWANAIHGVGLRVLWRGTWSGIEGLYNFKKLVGSNRFPTGSVETAQTDGQNSWLGKTYAYITSHPDYFANGDIWAPLPERTENIFFDDRAFLPSSGGIQKNYAQFFNSLKKTSDLAFNKIGLKVYTGWTANNFSEAKSGWLYNSIFDNADMVVVDYYGSSHTAEEMDTQLRLVYKKYGKQIFLQEWSDYWNGQLSENQRGEYLKSMYSTFQKLANDGILAGFNYWGGWSGGSGEGILAKTKTGYTLNSRGQTLADFFKANLKN